MYALPDDAGQTIYHDSTFQDAAFKTIPGECSLKRFSVSSYDLEFLKVFRTMPATRQSTVAAVTETTDPSCLRNYGVVQYIRGCIYTTRTNNITGASEKYFLTRDSRGETVDFHHPVWEVDTSDLDPLYNSYNGDDETEAKRLDWQQYAKVPLLQKPDQASLTKDYDIYFIQKNFSFAFKSPTPLKQTYMSDTPSGSAFIPDAGMDSSEVETSSLEFMTCLYNIKDIPMRGSPAGFDVAEANGGPIKCFAWSDKSKFNKKLVKFERTEEMDPFCVSPQ